MTKPLKLSINQRATMKPTRSNSKQFKKMVHLTENTNRISSSSPSSSSSSLPSSSSPVIDQQDSASQQHQISRQISCVHDTHGHGCALLVNNNNSVENFNYHTVPEVGAYYTVEVSPVTSDHEVEIIERESDESKEFEKSQNSDGFEKSQNSDGHRNPGNSKESGNEMDSIESENIVTSQNSDFFFDSEETEDAWEGEECESSMQFENSEDFENERRIEAIQNELQMFGISERCEEYPVPQNSRDIYDANFAPGGFQTDDIGENSGLGLNSDCDIADDELSIANSEEEDE